MYGCESATLVSHWVLVVMDQFTRRLTGFGVQCGDVDGRALCRMFNKAISGQGQPGYLSSDNDPLFNYHQWRANLCNLEIEEIKTVPYLPMSHPFVDRLLGTIRRNYWLSFSSGHRTTWSKSPLDTRNITITIGRTTPYPVTLRLEPPAKTMLGRRTWPTIAG